MKRLASSLYWGETFFYDDNAEVVYESETANLRKLWMNIYENLSWHNEISPCK